MTKTSASGMADQKISSRVEWSGEGSGPGRDGRAR